MSVISTACRKQRPHHRLPAHFNEFRNEFDDPLPERLPLAGRLCRLLARALAGEPPLILADEPISGLDPAHRLEVMGLLRRLTESGTAVVVVLHDLTLAARYCHRLVLMQDGRVAADGPPDAVLTAQALGRVFGIRAHFDRLPDGPLVVPVARLDGDCRP